MTYERAEREGFVERLPASMREADPARALGWLSIGLGVAALAAAGPLSRAIGLPGRTTLIRLVGLRELASGAGLLTQRKRAPWLWSRVAGDAMDLALLGTGTRSINPLRGRTFGAIATVAAVATADVAAALRERAREGSIPRTRADEPLIEESMSVARSPQECYAFWRDVANLPKFIKLLKSVTAIDDRRSHWVIEGPRGVRLEWGAEITVDRPGERLAWHSMSGSPVTHAGVVRFDAAPGGRGTLVRVMMHYQPPAGHVGSGLAKLLGTDARSLAREDLRRFKSLMETGEIPTTRGQPSGRRSVLGRAMSARGGATEGAQT